MFCREVNELVQPYLDGLLKHNQAQKVDEHTAACAKCRQKLALMQEIPLALRTDRMLAPKPDFTAAVMQQLIINQHFKAGEQHPFRTESQTTVTMVSMETTPPPVAAPKVVKLEEHRKAASFSRNRTNYLLRFSGAAAALLLIVGVGIYLNQLTGTGSQTSAQASVSSAISSYATMIVDSFQSPLILIVGIVLAVVIIVATWWYMRRSQTTR
jgi:anti-sigma factor RsiW